MDLAAELTLQIADFLQSDSEIPRSPRQWLLVPGRGGSPAPFPTAVDRLAALEKPVIVGALNHPGQVAVWSVRDCDESEQRHFNHTLGNQQLAFTEAMTHLGCDDDSIVMFEGFGSQTHVPARDVKRWLGEYALTWGWTIGGPTDESHQARFLVLKGGRSWSPGETCSARPHKH